MPKSPPKPKAKSKPKAPPHPTKAKPPSPNNRKRAASTTVNNRQPPPVVPDVTAQAHLTPGRTKGCTDRHKAFARELFAHGNATAAYRKVFGGAGKSRKTLDAGPFRLKRHKTVINELRRLERLHAEELAAKAAAADKARAQAEKDAIATRTEVLKFHTRVMRASSSDLSATNKDLVLVTEKKTLAPPKTDKDGDEIPHPDADPEGYVTEVTRRPPDIKERSASANAIAAMQGWNKGDPALAKVGDQLTNLLLEIRGGGKV